MTARIDRLWPGAAENLSDEDLIADLAADLDAADLDAAGSAGGSAGTTAVRFNFVSSVDGAATRDGRSGGLSGAADKRLFELLRRVCDVVLVGAGTVRDEGYGAMRVSDASAAWREAHGRPPHPVFAIVTGELDLDVASGIFSDAPVRPIVLTTEMAARTAGFAALSEVADVVAVGSGGSGGSGGSPGSGGSAGSPGSGASGGAAGSPGSGGAGGAAGSARVGARPAIEALRARGLHRILCEGGPTLFGTFIADDAVDELCITISPSLEAGDAPRIANGASPPRELRLVAVLRSGDTLLLRYLRAGASPS